MFATVTQSGGMLILRDQHGQQVGNLTISNGEFLGHSRDFVVIKYEDMIITMDQNQSKLGSTPLPSNFKVQGVTESGFYARTGNMIVVFDRYCNRIDQYPI